jgi:hypothetical protein
MEARMASKESGLATVVAPRIWNPGLTAWAIGMLVVAAAGFVAGNLVQTDTSGTAVAEKTATASFSVEAVQESRALNPSTTSTRSLPTLNLDAVRDTRALNAQVPESENFLIKKFINQGLIPRQAVLNADVGR